MVIELINIILIVWIYFYLIKLYQSGCKCALTPNYYFLVFYICISLLLLFFGVLSHNDGLKFTGAYIGVAFSYFVLTVVFIFVTFGYIKELESDKCECAGEMGPDVIAIFAWVRILSFILALAGVIMMLYGHNNLLTIRKATPRVRAGL